MNGKGSRYSGVFVAIVIAALFLTIALAGLPSQLPSVFGNLKEPKDKPTLAQLIVSFFGFLGAISAFSFAIFQYRKSERWKRMEFVAREEVKDFESNPTVENALLMVDWGTRKINLFLVRDPKPADLVLITRDIQWRALLPHPIKQNNVEYQAKDTDAEESPAAEKSGGEAGSGQLGFTEVEARIRDTYDLFLTRLDRLSTFIRANLINADELRHFIDYWINAITSTDG